MKRIGILGANGQVGMEVCFLLKQWSGAEVVGICRNELSATTLRHLGIPYRVIGANSGDDLYSDLDLIADFTLPSGSIREIVGTHQQIMRTALTSTRSDVPYVYMSSQMAFGMSQRRRQVRDYWIADTIYGTTKRRAEKAVSKVGRELGYPVYLLRLGQVHGILQPVTMAMKQQAATSPKYRVPKYRVPRGPSFTVFCYSIAEALVNIADGRESPGRYTLVSNPAWTWKEFLQYLGATDIEEVDVTSPKAFSLSSIQANLQQRIMGFAESHKEFIQSHLLCHMPKLESSLRTRNWCKNAKRSLQSCRQAGVIDLDVFQGELPGQRLTSMSDSRESMSKMTEQSVSDLASRKLGSLRNDNVEK